LVFPVFINTFFLNSKAHRVLTSLSTCLYQIAVNTNKFQTESLNNMYVTNKLYNDLDSSNFTHTLTRNHTRTRARTQIQHPYCT